MEFAIPNNCELHHFKNEKKLNLVFRITEIQGHVEMVVVAGCFKHNIRFMLFVGWLEAKNKGNHWLLCDKRFSI